MGKLIEAEILIEKAKIEAKGMSEPFKTNFAILVEWLADKTPETVVRCENCENWVPGYVTDNDDFIPPKCGKYQQMVGHSSNDYCSYGERKTDE